MEETRLWSLLLCCPDFSDLYGRLAVAGGIKRNPDFHHRPKSHGTHPKSTTAYSYRGKTYRTRKELILEHAKHGLTYEQVMRRINCKGWHLEKALTTPLK